MKDKNYMLSSIDTKNQPNSAPFMIKTLNKLGKEGNYLIIKVMYEKHTVNILNSEKQSFPSKTGNKARRHTLAISTQHSPES
jgi:hypothetical protein